VPELSACALDMAIEKVNRHKLPDSDWTATELIKESGRKFLSEIHDDLLASREGPCSKQLFSTLTWPNKT
jgi:hypothetical protein